MSQTTPVLTVQPKFEPPLIAIRILGLAMLGVPFITAWGGGMISALQGSHGLVWANHLLAGSVGLVLGLPSIPLWYWVLQQNYANTVYHFYEDKVEYSDGFFFNRSRKVMSYKNIISIQVNHSILQQGFNLGTLKLITNATEGSSSRAAGLKLQDIVDADAVYQQIKPFIMG